MDIVTAEIELPIRIEADILAARQKGRELAVEIGFTGSDLALIATAISEITRNILQHAGHGEVVLSISHEPERRGIRVVAADAGPGISDVDRAMQDGFSTKHSLGLGLPGARRLMDEFEIVSLVGEGTRSR